MAKGPERKKTNWIAALMLVLIAVFVFSIVFAVIIIPLSNINSQLDLRAIFIVLLIYSSTVAAAVTLIFYLIFAKRI